MYDDEEVRFVSYWPKPETAEETDARIRFYDRALIVTLLVLAFVVAPLCWLLERVAPL